MRMLKQWILPLIVGLVLGVMAEKKGLVERLMSKMKGGQ